LYQDDSHTDSCVHCVKKCEVFQMLSEKELDMLYEKRSEAFYRPGEAIVKQGAPVSHLISISDGIVKLVLETPNTPDIILSIHIHVFMIAGPGIYVDNRYHFSVVALTNAKACFMDIRHLHEFIEQNHNFAKKFYRQIGLASVQLYDRIRSLNQKNMAGRVSEIFLFLYHEIHRTNPFDLILSRTELAQFAGITKESISRILKDFKEEKIIEITNDSVHILDFSKLQSIARIG